METKTIKTDSTVTGITENYNNALTSIIAKIKANDYIVKINNTEVSVDELANIKFDPSNLTKSGRKKVAKRLYIYEQKGTIKSINYLYHVLNKISVIQDKIKIDVSHKEAEIQLARKAYIKLRVETEAARIAYKLAKGDFYKN